ncbi:MAG: hypothetical protein ACP5D7_19530 [Limnospira sp.]
MLVLTLILRGYVAIAILTFAYFFRGFWRDRSTAKTDRSSWQVLGVASLFWPVVLPLSYLERRTNATALKAEMYEGQVHPDWGGRSLPECPQWDDHQVS